MKKEQGPILVESQSSNLKELQESINHLGKVFTELCQQQTLVTSARFELQDRLKNFRVAKLQERNLTGVYKTDILEVIQRMKEELGEGEPRMRRLDLGAEVKEITVICSELIYSLNMTLESQTRDTGSVKGWKGKETLLEYENRNVMRENVKRKSRQATPFKFKIEDWRSGDENEDVESKEKQLFGDEDDTNVDFKIKVEGLSENDEPLAGRYKERTSRTLKIKHAQVLAPSGNSGRDPGPGNTKRRSQSLNSTNLLTDREKQLLAKATSKAAKAKVVKVIKMPKERKGSRNPGFRASYPRGGDWRYIVQLSEKRG